MSTLQNLLEVVRRLIAAGRHPDQAVMDVVQTWTLGAGDAKLLKLLVRRGKS